jgi:hypothetical protein
MKRGDGGVAGAPLIAAPALNELGDRRSDVRLAPVHARLDDRLVGLG